ncbi:MAG: glycoside hydrolase family 3 N-terminal domain-containing protein [Candidatus Dojkabacteria bacterium]|jgi:beta-N-acetylhexosaminidase|nr:glycoside hydrolase family 3 N-terminal domain-containing protein [Candidatus Dojkabacteria bacterium]
MKNVLTRNKKILKLLGLGIFILIYLSLLIYVNDLPKPGNFLKTGNINHKEVARRYDRYRTDSKVYLEFAKLDTKSKIGQMFMLSLPTSYYDDETNSLIEEYQIGGAVLMGQNITSQPQLTDYIKTLQNKSKTKLLIATDQEGGIVGRIPWDNARYISQPHIGIVGREDFAYSTGESHALALKQFNINVNLAPVLDISFDPGSSIMVNRTLGSTPGEVTMLGMEIIKAHQDNGVIAAAKHFPGIGRTTTDSHLALPEINVSKDKLLIEEIVPFKEAINIDVQIIMVGHALYPKIDKKHPSSLSQKIIKEILRDFLKFDGIILTDDIHMQALDKYPDKVVAALNAGNDMIMIVDTYENQVSFMEQLEKAVSEGRISEERIDESVKRILRVKIENKIIK